MLVTGSGWSWVVSRFRFGWFRTRCRFGNVRFGDSSCSSHPGWFRVGTQLEAHLCNYFNSNFSAGGLPTALLMGYWWVVGRFCWNCRNLFIFRNRFIFIFRNHFIFIFRNLFIIITGRMCVPTISKFMNRLLLGTITFILA